MMMTMDTLMGITITIDDADNISHYDDDGGAVGDVDV